jgi:hypothetical protein
MRGAGAFTVASSIATTYDRSECLHCCHNQERQCHFYAIIAQSATQEADFIPTTSTTQEDNFIITTSTTQEALCIIVASVLQEEVDFIMV